MGATPISVQIVVGRTLCCGTMSFVVMRGRPSKTHGPDDTSSHLARTIGGTTRALSVHLISRIVITNGGCCDCTSRKELRGEWNKQRGSHLPKVSTSKFFFNDRPGGRPGGYFPSCQVQRHGVHGSITFRGGCVSSHRE